MISADIRKSRKERGLNENWDIWRDGCEGGESPEDVSRRLDALIKDLREKYHKGMYFLCCAGMNIGLVIEAKTDRYTGKFGKDSGWKGKDGEPNDVLIVAHGHILRSFAARWVGKSLVDNPSLILEAGGVGTLR